MDNSSIITTPALAQPHILNFISPGISAVAALLLLLALQGCATYSTGFGKVESATARRDLDDASKALDELKLSGADQQLQYLNKATLLRLRGDFAESNRQFEAAKTLMEQLSAISLKEQAASVSVNDSFKAYEGLPHEQLLIYAFTALNYLQMNDVDAAAIEARQFDVKQGLLAGKNAGAKYLTGAFVRYLNGMIYDAAGEQDSARIEMQKALEGYKAQGAGMGIPASLAADLARIKSGTPAPNEAVFILHNGLGPSLKEETIHVPNPNPKQGSALLSLAVPKFFQRTVPVSRVELSAGTLSSNAELVEDINDLAHKSLNDRMPGITARAVARLVVKNAAAGETKKRSNSLGAYGALAGFAMDVGTAVSERADTRSWSLLPGNINMARLALPPGKHDIKATYYGMGGNVIGSRIFRDVEIKPGHKTFISDYVLN